MATSGTISGTTNNIYITARITWSCTQSVENNTSTVTATLQYRKSSTSTASTYGSFSGKIVINGTSKSVSKYLTLSPNNTWVTVGSSTVTVSHSADGTKSISIYATGGISGTSFTSTSCTATVTLDTIPRATTPTLSVSSVNMGSAVSITLNRATSSFTHNLSYSFGSLTDQTSGLSSYTGVGTSATFTAPLTLANQIPSALSGTCTIKCDTYNGSTLIGTKTVSLTLNVPSSVVPTISSVSISEATSGIVAKFAAYVQNKSTLSVAITATGSYGSTIASYETYIQSVPYRTQSFTSAVITASGTVGVVTTVTDTRGRTAQVSNSITVLPYSSPVINSMSAFRITTAGVASDDGTRIAVSMNFAISSVSGRNDRTYTLKYKKSTDDAFTTIASGTASTSYDDTQYFTSSPVISTDYAYTIRLEISDYFTTVIYDFDVPTAFTIMDFRNTGKGMAIGKVSEKDALEVAMNMEITGQAKIFAPALGVADSGLLRLYRHDESLLAFLATSDNGDGLNLHFYRNGAWSGVIKFTPDGAVIAANTTYGTATLSS